MKNFIEATNRLKTALSVSMDKEVAEYLGLSKGAFAERKKRGSFPKKELELLAQNKPELGLDVEFILTGFSMKIVQDDPILREMFEKDSEELKSISKTTQSGRQNALPQITIYPEPDDAVEYIKVSLIEAHLISAFRRSDDDSRQALLYN